MASLNRSCVMHRNQTIEIITEQTGKLGVILVYHFGLTSSLVSNVIFCLMYFRLVRLKSDFRKLN